MVKNYIQYIIKYHNFFIGNIRNETIDLLLNLFFLFIVTLVNHIKVRLQQLVVYSTYPYKSFMTAFIEKYSVSILRA